MSTAPEASQQANRAGMDPKRLVVIFYLATGVILALFFDHVLQIVWGKLGWRNTEIGGLSWTTTGILGVVLALASVVSALAHPRTRQLSIEVASELMKVTWPTWSETRVATMAVVIASLVAAVILFGIDNLSYRLMVEWLPSLWGKLS